MAQTRSMGKATLKGCSGQMRRGFRPTAKGDSPSRHIPVSPYRHGALGLRIEAGPSDQFAELGGQIGRREERVFTKKLGMLSVQRIEFIQTMGGNIGNASQSVLGKL